MQHLQPNTTLQGGKYKIERVLGQGGFGITYSAIQVTLNRRVAIKEFFMKEYCERNADTSHITLGTASGAELVNRFKDKFLKEAALIAQFDNPHIVRIHDIFEENGTAYYVMEFLENRWSQFGKNGIPWELSLNIIKQVGDGLNYLHSQNVLHLDVKPSNILFRKDCAVLIDFGISKRYDSQGGQTSTTPVGVSKGYAPLEQYNQGVQVFQPATDIYSLGATLYKMLTGETPPEASEIMNYGFPTDLLQEKQVPDKIISVIQKCMQPRMGQRFQSINQLSDAIGILPKSVTSERERMQVQEDEETIIANFDNHETTIKENHKTELRKKKKTYWGILVLDGLIFVFSGYLSYYLFNGGDEVTRDFWPILFNLCILFVPYTIAFRIFHTYSRIFQYSCLVNLGRLALAMLLGFVILFAVYKFVPLEYQDIFTQHYPRYILLLLISTLLMWAAHIIIVLSVGNKKKDEFKSEKILTETNRSNYTRKRPHEVIKELIVRYKNPPLKNVEEKLNNKQTMTTLYHIYAAFQYIVFGSILLVMSSMFLFGLLTMEEGNEASKYNILLCICLCGTLYSTYLLFTKKKMKAFYYIGALDIAEIILLCAVALQIAKYALKTGYHYHSFPYMQINGLGWEMINRGDFLVTLLMESFALIHIITLVIVIMVEIKRKNILE